MPHKDDRERDLFGYVPQHVAPDPGLSSSISSLDPYPHPTRSGKLPTTVQLNRYLHHPDPQVGMVSMEAGAARRLKVVVIIF